MRRRPSMSKVSGTRTGSPTAPCSRASNGLRKNTRWRYAGRRSRRSPFAGPGGGPARRRPAHRAARYLWQAPPRRPRTRDPDARLVSGQEGGRSPHAGSRLSRGQPVRRGLRILRRRGGQAARSLNVGTARSPIRQCHPCRTRRPTLRRNLPGGDLGAKLRCARSRKPGLVRIPGQPRLCGHRQHHVSNSSCFPGMG